MVILMQFPIVSKTSCRLTRSEAAEYMGVTPQTLANWASTGKVQIPHYKVGRKIIYFQSDLDAYLASTRRTQTL